MWALFRDNPPLIQFTLSLVMAVIVAAITLFLQRHGRPLVTIALVLLPIVLVASAIQWCVQAHVSIGILDTQTLEKLKQANTH
jgi:predicted PurR-regulated permease PerM